MGKGIVRLGGLLAAGAFLVSLAEAASKCQSVFGAIPALHLPSNREDVKTWMNRPEARISQSELSSIYENFKDLKQIEKDFLQAPPPGGEPLTMDNFWMLLAVSEKHSKKIETVLQYIDIDGVKGRNFFFKLNTSLRQGTLTPDERQFVKNMNRELENFPAVHRVAYRGARMTLEEIDASYPRDRIVTEKAYLSSSLSREVAVKFATMKPENVVDDGRVGVVYLIEGHSGRFISFVHPYENLRAEQEVLFRAGTRFEVMERSAVREDAEAGPVVFVHLREVP